MELLTARPRLLKQANLSLIRRVIKNKGTATRAEITGETRISSTTVRALLTEMLDNGEIESIGHDESSGGRKAERYCFKPDRYYCAVFCMADQEIHSLLVNVCGEIRDISRLEIPDGDAEAAIFSYMDQLIKEKEIKSIGLGVPGVVEGGCFWRQDKTDGTLRRIELGEHLKERYGLPVIMENDLNATAVGFERCYESEFPGEDPEHTNMVYLHLEKGCISAGIIAGGRIIRGCNNFAGELGLIPDEGDQQLDDCLAEAGDQERYVRLLVRIISWICGILNPQYVVLGGPGLKKESIGPAGDGLSAVLPKHMLAEILYAPDIWKDYYEGMACLTSAKMFDEVQFVKERL